MPKSSKDYLIEYVDYGFSVFPIGPSKKPTIEWKEFQKRKMTAEEVLSVSKKCTMRGDLVSGIGVATGEISGVTVIDIDGDNNPIGDIDTPTVRTGGGGTHYYFKYTDELHTTSNPTLKIDIRNDGGYAVLPPSKSTKGIYTWVKDLSTPLAEVPKSFIDSYESEVTKHEWSFEGMENGGRNNASKSVVGYLVKTFRDDLDLAWASFRAWNDRNTPPIEEEQLRATFEWCVNKDKSNHHILAKAGSFADRTDEELLTFTERETAKTGLAKIDNKFPHPTGFYLICANPGVGKGWYALWLTRRFYENNSLKSIYFSLEMTEELIKKRILQAWSDLTEEQFNRVKNKKEYIKALELLKKDMIRVDEFGGSDTSGITVENLKKKIEEYYSEGFRVFHFDHMHELDGANDNVRNQAVTEKWAKSFQGICKEHPDIWLFVYVQPNGKSAKSDIIFREDVAGSKAVTQKCEYFISLNRAQKDSKDVEVGEDEMESREVIIYIDKNRITSAQHIGFKVYFSYTGNFVQENDNYLGGLLK